ncbi:hypothetical protein O7602_27475 [Micromonospora sp. WMMD1128]|uniref:hypothetical protein n=1 Tax=Micromonospora sp. WMMD1128 TaxID=3015150 RepID=UPI00248B7006|nr:hypothetical protein [Micromonospora sp. WMMD1128]WBB73374.1 hypothetical protein O7602_27475 [Micromonospora sp. WMMD1128]
MRRLCVSASAAALATLGVVTALPAPALADPGPGWVRGWLYDTTVGGSTAPARTAALFVDGSPDAVHPRVDIDVSGLAGIVTATFPAWCDRTGASVVCPMPPDATPNEFGGLSGTVPIVFRAVPGDADGAAGTIGWTALADGVDGEAQQATVTVHTGPDAVDLVDAYVDGVGTGDRLAMPVALVSAGDRPVTGLRATFRFPVGLEPTAYRNCRYGTGGQLDTIVVCQFGRELKPGRRYEVPGGFRTTVGPAAIGDKRVVQTVAPEATAGPLPEGVVLRHRPAESALELRPVGGQVDVLGPDQQFGSGSYYLRAVRGAYDVVAVGATVAGAPGDTVRVRVGLRNDGPGVPDGTISGDSASHLVFTPPAGTVVTNSPEHCSNGADEEDPTAPAVWYCTLPNGVFPAGSSFLVDVDLRVDGPLGAPGTVAVRNAYPGPDDDPANDTAPVTIG